MLRWGHDIIFLRVICISLIAVALIFAIILTNVFVDVDCFFVSKMCNKEDSVNYNKSDNEAKGHLYIENILNHKNTVYRSKRSSNDLSQSSFKSIYKDKNNMYNMEINPAKGAVDHFQANNLGMIMKFLQNNKTNPQAFQQLNVISTLLETLFKLRPKRQVDYDGTADKNNSNNINNATMEDNRHIDIEIKTHFDSKTTNSGRKQFISHLIDKIRRALRSDTEVISNGIDNEPYFKTRDQEPIIITKKIMLESRYDLTSDDRRKIDKYNTIETNRKPKFKDVKAAERGNKYVEDFRNSLERRFQKPIADNTELKPDYNSLSFLNNIDGPGASMDYDRYIDDPTVQRVYSGLDNVIKVYHNTIV